MHVYYLKHSTHKCHIIISVFACLGVCILVCMLPFLHLCVWVYIALFVCVYYYKCKVNIEYVHKAMI